MDELREKKDNENFVRLDLDEVRINNEYRKGQEFS